MLRLHRVERIIRAIWTFPKKDYETNPIGPLFSTKANQESQFPIAQSSDETQRNATRNRKMARGCRRCRAVAALAAAAHLQQPFAT
jgi:hypothetical protein